MLYPYEPYVFIFIKIYDYILNYRKLIWTRCLEDSFIKVREFAWRSSLEQTKFKILLLLLTIPNQHWTDILKNRNILTQLSVWIWNIWKYIFSHSSCCIGHFCSSTLVLINTLVLLLTFDDFCIVILLH